MTAPTLPTLLEQLPPDGTTLRKLERTVMTAVALELAAGRAPTGARIVRALRGTADGRAVVGVVAALVGRGVLRRSPRGVLEVGA